jgi:hypothetical protein
VLQSFETRVCILTNLLSFFSLLLFEPVPFQLFFFFQVEVAHFLHGVPASSPASLSVPLSLLGRLFFVCRTACL